MGLSFLVLSLGLKSYTFIHQSYHELLNKKEVIQSARVGFYQLSQSIEAAGYIGGRSRDSSYPLYDLTQESQTYREPFIWVGHPDLPVRMETLPKALYTKLSSSSRSSPCADWIILKHVPDLYNEVISFIKEEKQLKPRSIGQYKTGQRLIFSNHLGSIVFTLKSVNCGCEGEGHTLMIHEEISDVVSSLFGHGGELHRSKDLIYYLYQSDNEKNQKTPIRFYDLYEQDLGSPYSATPIIRGISDMHIKLGIMDERTKHISFFNPEAVSHGLKVHAVQVNLLFFVRNRVVRSPVYQWRDKQEKAPSGYQAMPWQFTIEVPYA